MTSFLERFYQECENDSDLERVTLAGIKQDFDCWKKAVVVGCPDHLIKEHQKLIESELNSDAYWGPNTSVDFDPVYLTMKISNTDGRILTLGGENEI